MSPATEVEDLLQALGVSRGAIVALAGAGGKTTLAYRLASEARRAGWRVIVTTTTHMGVLPEAVTGPVLLGTGARSREVLASALRREGRATLLGEAVRPDKIRGLVPEAVDDLSGSADLIVVEADGARSRSLKVPNDTEPVVPSRTDLLVVVAALDVLGQPLDEERVHRLDLVAAATGRVLGERVDAEVVAAALSFGPGYPSRLPPGARLVAFLNKAEDTGTRAEAQRIAAMIVPPYALVVAGSARGGPVRVLS